MIDEFEMDIEENRICKEANAEFSSAFLIVYVVIIGKLDQDGNKVLQGMADPVPSTKAMQRAVWKPDRFLCTNVQDFRTSWCVSFLEKGS